MAEPTAREVRRQRAESIQRFAESFAELPPNCLVAAVEGQLKAAERAAVERAAKIAESMLDPPPDAVRQAGRARSWAVRNYESGWRQAVHKIAAAIRARGKG